MNRDIGSWRFGHAARWARLRSPGELAIVRERFLSPRGPGLLKKVGLACLFLILGMSGCLYSLAAEPGRDAQLKVAVGAPYPPFAEHDAEGNLIGFDVDMAEALCRELGKRCEVRSLGFESILPALASGEIDFAVAGMAASEERKRYVDFTDRYYRSRSIFIEKPGSVGMVTADSIKGLRVGTQTGTAQEEHLREEYGDLITIITSDSFDEILQMLKQGELDLVLVDGLPGYAYLKADLGNGLETVGEAVSSKSVPDWACIAVSKKRPGLRDALNKAIESLRRSGEYGRINRKYFDFTIY